MWGWQRNCRKEKRRIGKDESPEATRANFAKIARNAIYLVASSLGRSCLRVRWVSTLDTEQNNVRIVTNLRGYISPKKSIIFGNFFKGDKVNFFNIRIRALRTRNYF